MTTYRHTDVDEYIDSLNYLLYDGNCTVCKICAFFGKKIFKKTIFLSFDCFYRHWYMFPETVKKLNRKDVNLFLYSHDEWLYGDEAISFLCGINQQPFGMYLNIFRVASKLRKKCNTCKLRG